LIWRKPYEGRPLIRNKKIDFLSATSHKGQDMAKRNSRDYYCDVIREPVKIYLKNKATIGLKYKRDYFVQCNQEDCQYVDENTAPCPLGVEMFGLLNPV
jgi:hypothetical protein